MTHLEIEFKTMLTKEEHDRLLQLFADISPISQTNYYIESDQQSIRHAHMAFRVRTFNHREAELTLKIPQEVGSLELNQNLTPEETENILQNNKFPTGEILETLLQKEIPIQDLKILGSLETIRYEKEDEIGLLALDESHYLGKTDFELEVEVEDFEKGKENFLNFLKQHKIDYKPSKSKIARFSENL